MAFLSAFLTVEFFVYGSLLALGFLILIENICSINLLLYVKICFPYLMDSINT